MADEYYLKYGGIKFTSNVSAKTINEFVLNLSEEKRASLYLVAKELADQGLITLHKGQFSTIDEEMQAYLE